MLPYDDAPVSPPRQPCHVFSTALASHPHPHARHAPQSISPLAKFSPLPPLPTERQLPKPSAHPFAQPQHYLPIGSSKQPVPRFNEDIFAPKWADIHSRPRIGTEQGFPNQTGSDRRGAMKFAREDPDGPPTIRKESSALFDLLSTPLPQIEDQDKISQKQSGLSAVNSNLLGIPGTTAGPRSRETRLLSIHNLSPRDSLPTSTRKESSTLGDLHNTSVRKESGTLPDRGRRGEREGSFTYSELGELYPYRQSWLRETRPAPTPNPTPVLPSLLKISDELTAFEANENESSGSDDDEIRELEPARRESQLTVPGISLEEIWPSYADEQYYQHDPIPTQTALHVDMAAEAEFRKPSWDLASLSLFPSPPDRSIDDDDSIHTSTTRTSSLATPISAHRPQRTNQVGVHRYHGTNALRRGSEISYLDFGSDEGHVVDPGQEHRRLQQVKEENEGEVEVRTIIGVDISARCDDWQGFWSEPSSPVDSIIYPGRKQSEAQRIKDAYLYKWTAPVRTVISTKSW